MPYIHGVPHLGNAVGSVLPADIFHRYLDIKGVKNEFICGGDVHGTPLELEALERETTPKKIKDDQMKEVRKAYEDLNMDFSIFSDTHSDYNKKQTFDMFEELYCKGYINEKTQTMPYCNNDERFLPDRYIEGECPHCGGLARGDQCDDCGKLVEPEELENPECQICNGNDISFDDTTHLFLDLEPFKPTLKNWLDKDVTPVPDNFESQVDNLIEDAEQRSITRDQEWGFKIPVERVNERIEEEDLDVPKLDPDTYEDKVLYVWFDAPIGYIGFTRELFEDGEEWKDQWSGEDTDVYYSIGKDNTIFHTVIWPSMLDGASNEDIDYNLPHYEFIQQYMMWEDQAFSKSRGVGIFIDEATEYYPADYWRFYLTRVLPTDHDTNFSWEGFESEINNVLNDTVGNFVNRTLSLAEKWFDNEVPIADKIEKDQEMVREAEALVDRYIEHFEQHELREAMDTAVDLARLGDRYLAEEEPWNNAERQEPVIQVCIRIIRALAVTMYPFTPETSEEIAGMLNTDIHSEEGYNELVDPLLGGLEAGHELGEREILFDKIDTEEYQEKYQKEQKREEAKQKYNEDTVSFSDFQDMDMRTGEVAEVEEHPNADKLYKVKVDIGDATLQTCAGLKNHYGKEDLEGKNVVVLANLEPSELRGEKSECMILVAEDSSGELSLLTTEDDMELGSKVE